MTVDISSEAFERLAKDCDRAQRDHDQWTREAHLHFDAAATLRAQAERIKELESAAMDRLVAEGQRCDAMTPQEAAKVREAVGKQATAVNRAFIIAAQVRPAHAAKAIHDVELILEKAVKALRAISEDSHE